MSVEDSEIKKIRTTLPIVEITKPKAPNNSFQIKMAISNSQLETWSKQGSKDASSATYQSIQNALVGTDSPIRYLITSDKVKVCLRE